MIPICEKISRALVTIPLCDKFSYFLTQMLAFFSIQPRVTATRLFLCDVTHGGVKVGEALWAKFVTVRRGSTWFIEVLTSHRNIIYEQTLLCVFSIRYEEEQKQLAEENCGLKMLTSTWSAPAMAKFQWEKEDFLISFLRPYKGAWSFLKGPSLTLIW